MTTRRSGRTGRMLEAVIARARRGGLIVVVAAHEAQAQDLVIRIRALAPDAKNTRQSRFHISVPPGTVVIETLGAFTDREVMDLNARGYADNSIYWDHYALETKFARVLTELHRWDAGHD